MSRYLLVHKDHPLRVTGINAGAEMATLHLARFLAKRGEEVYVAAHLPEGDVLDRGVQFWDIGEEFDFESAITRIRTLGDYHLVSAGRSHPFFLTKEDSSCLSRILISPDRSAHDAGMNAKALCHHVDRIVCVSDAQREIFLKAGAPEEKVKTEERGVAGTLCPEEPGSPRCWEVLRSLVEALGDARYDGHARC